MKIASGKISLITFVALLAMISGCISVGPETISRDRFDYGQAIANSWEEQMLSNMLRVRYGETPVFLDVSQVINQYSLEGNVGADGIGAGGATGEAWMRWSDRPTITYTPLTGRRFTQSLLTPMDPASVFAMIESGWSADLVFAVVVRSINGIRNSASDNAEFESVIASIARLQRSNVVGFSVVSVENADRVQVNFNERLADERALADIALVRNTLGLDEGVDQFELEYGARQLEPNTIYLQTRTMLQVLEELSHGIAVPAEHASDGRTMPVPDASGPAPKSRELLKVQSSLEKPENALVAVARRGYWFYVDDRDFRSKRVFAFLMIMLNLAESDEQNVGPVLTIGAGG